MYRYVANKKNNVSCSAKPLWHTMMAVSFIMYTTSYISYKGKKKKMGVLYFYDLRCASLTLILASFYYRPSDLAQTRNPKEGSS